MNSFCKRMVCVTLLLCSLVLSCVTGAAGAVSQPILLDSPQQKNNSNPSPMSSDVALDAPITRYGASWYQEAGYCAYRLWIDNTTGALMTVTITSPSGKKETVYVTSGNNKSYVNNNAEAGAYFLSFHTYADALSGTVRVRISTVPLS